MNIKLYNFSKRKNSTLQPSHGTEVNVALKSDCSIYTPIFLLCQSNIENYNYLFWNGRYYYINDITKTNIKDTWELNCNIDVLATYKTDILNTSAFVTYSTSSYNTMLADNRLSTDPVPSTLAYYEDCFQWNVSGLGGTYVLSYLSYASSNCKYAPVAINLFDADNIKNVGQVLMSDGMISAMQYISQQLGAAKDAIISCKYTPLTGYYNSDGSLSTFYDGTDINVMLGQYASPNPTITAKSPSSRLITRTINVTIPRIFSDFRITGAYNRLLMFLPAYGYLNLNATDFTGQSTISVKYVLDVFSGELTYIVGGDKGQRVVTSLYSDIPLGVNKTDVMGALDQAIGGVSDIAGGNAVEGVGKVFNSVLANQEHNVGVVGTLNGIGSIVSNVETNTGKIYLVSINRDTNTEPSSMAERYGRPLNEVKTLSSLSGYVQTAEASVVTNAPDNIKDEINNYLNGGVYIE